MLERANYSLKRCERRNVQRDEDECLTFLQTVQRIPLWLV
jgi:hypothetical protein